MKKDYENERVNSADLKHDEKEVTAAVQSTSAPEAFRVAADLVSEAPAANTEHTQAAAQQDSQQIHSGVPLPEEPQAPPAFPPASKQDMKSPPPAAPIPPETAGGWGSSGRKYQKKRSKKPIVVASVLTGLVVIGVGLWFGVFKDKLEMQKADPVFVSSVGVITGVDLSGTPKYAGKVEAQKTVSVNKDSTKTVKELYVNVDDVVEKGTKLFTYDATTIQLDLDTSKLDLTGIENKVKEYNDQITDLEKERDKASSEDKLSYTLRIQSMQLDIKQEEINLAAKKKEIENLQKSLENIDVFAEESGVVKSINENGGTDNTGNPLPYISILKIGDFRIKGTISEQNYNNLSIGQAVVVQSRIDPGQTWNGVVESIDKESSSDNATNGAYAMWGSGGGQPETSSKFSFYVTLENLDGLILGQHVYIEPSAGDAAVKEGLWLPEYYIVHNDEGEAYVWARDKSEKLEKRILSLGEYDEGSGTYQILSGLTEDDYIAFPEENCKSGMPTVVQENTYGFSGMQGGETYPGFSGDTNTADGAVLGEDGNPIGGAEDNGMFVEDGDGAQASISPDGGNAGNTEKNSENNIITPSGGDMEPHTQELTPSGGNMGVFG